MNGFTATITIASGQTLSAALDLDTYGVRYIRRLLVLAPATLPESVTLSVSMDNSTYFTLQSGAADIVFPAGKATQVNGFLCRYIKMLAGGAVASDRLFTLSIAAE